MKPFKKAHRITEDKRKNKRFSPNSAFNGTSFILVPLCEMPAVALKRFKLRMK